MRSHRSLAALLVLPVAILFAAGMSQGSDGVRASVGFQPPRATNAVLQDDPVAAGKALFRTACASCHGDAGEGTPEGPTLIGVGAASADFQLRTGRMPFAGPPGSQAVRKEPAFDDEQIDDLVAFVASLGEGPDIPEPAIDDALLSAGQKIFIGSCAPCHGATISGGAVGGGALAPPLTAATPVQVQEAMLTGPGQMPLFRLPQRDLDAVATYVDYLQRADHPGGFSIGGIGPVPEGLVAWVVGAGLMFCIVYLIGRRWDRVDAP